jgi:hypothetical protein
MTRAQQFVRLLFILPSLLLLLVFLPYKGGGVQFLGIADPDFLRSGAIDIVRLVLYAVVILVVGLVFDALVKSHVARV